MQGCKGCQNMWFQNMAKEAKKMKFLGRKCCSAYVACRELIVVLYELDL